MLDGEGARLYGGRWNSPGGSIVYASSTLSLAALEYLVHVDPSEAPADLVALTIEVPDSVPVGTADTGALPNDWPKRESFAECQAIGDEWVKSSSTALLRVPSALVPEEHNVLINPRHPQAAKIKIVAKRDFEFDSRLVG